MSVYALPNSQESPIIAEFCRRAKRLEPTFLFLGTRALNTELVHSYHRSWADSPHDDGYSVHYFGDKHMLQGKTDYACAIDYTFRVGGKAEGAIRTDLLTKYTARLLHLVQRTPRAHRRLAIREFACTLDGDNVFAFDCTIKEREYGWDTSHLTHTHMGWNRRLITSQRILRITDIFRD